MRWSIKAINCIIFFWMKRCLCPLFLNQISEWCFGFFTLICCSASRRWRALVFLTCCTSVFVDLWFISKFFGNVSYEMWIHNSMVDVIYRFWCVYVMRILSNEIPIKSFFSLVSCFSRWLYQTRKYHFPTLPNRTPT